MDFTNSSTGTVDLIVDGNGGFWPGNGACTYTPIEPTRVLDARKAIGDFQASLLPSGALPGFGTGLLKIGGDTKITAVPADANAAALNITVTGPTSGGYITACPSDQTTRPLGSTLNFPAGQTIANAASMLMIDRNSPAPNGIYLYNGSAGSVQLLVDVRLTAAPPGRARNEWSAGRAASLFATKASVPTPTGRCSPDAGSRP